MQILRGQILMLRAQFAYFSNEIEEAIRSLPGSIGAPTPIVDIRARRSDVVPGVVHASQRAGTGSRKVAAR